MLESNREIESKPADPYLTLSLRVAELVRQQIKRNPSSVLALPTGRTPTGCYKILARWFGEGSIDWSKCKCFGLDEYIDVEETDSFRKFLESNLYKFTNLPPNSRFNPMFIDDYDNLIAQHGGLDLTILGIGKNGHIAFNEPGTPLQSWTHSIWLTESTRQANAEFFKSFEKTPTKAVTMGIQTILASKKIVVVASGKQKKAILKRALEGPISVEVPASFLQTHKEVTVLTDFDV